MTINHQKVYLTTASGPPEPSSFTGLVLRSGGMHQMRDEGYEKSNIIQIQIPLASRM